MNGDTEQIVLLKFNLPLTNLYFTELNYIVLSYILKTVGSVHMNKKAVTFSKNYEWKRWTVKRDPAQYKVIGNVDRTNPSHIPNKL